MLMEYVEKNFRPAALGLIDQANGIIHEYVAAGYQLTLRQLYYQFVSRGLIENTERSYKKMGNIINDGRLAGLISWEAIEDRGRNLVTHPYYRSPERLLELCEDWYTEDLWKTQPYYVEVWVEKEALAGVVERVCNQYRVPFMSCKGYMSQSEQWEAGQRLQYQMGEDHEVVILHLGDHDPSGIDMTRDNADRLSMFAEADIEVRRLALNMNQVEELKPPPNPAKVTDSRAEGYIARYGGSSWELDALEPSYINSLIELELVQLIDSDLWGEAQEKEQRGKEQFREFRHQIEGNE